MKGKSSIPTTSILLAMTLGAVASSQIHAIGYDAGTSTLGVQFKGKEGAGSLYYYNDVSPETWDEFQKAESKGTFFGTRIKNNPAYPCIKYVPEEKNATSAA